MNDENELETLQKNRISQIKKLLVATLENANDEDDCTDKENEMYADMQNLVESINNYIER